MILELVLCRLQMSLVQCFFFFVQTQHPLSPKLCAFVRLLYGMGREIHWGRFIQTSGGKRELPSFSNEGGFSFWSSISSPLCLCSSFFLSLCRFLLSGSCLPHPKSCAKPFTSWICLGLTNTLWGRYYSKPILQMRKLRWREVPVSCPRSHS